MKKFRVFLYIIKQGFMGFIKNGFMIFASISVIFVALFILGSLNLTSLNLRHIVDKLSNKPEIRVDLESETTDTRVKELEKILEEDPRVKKIVIISKDEQYERFLEFFKDKKELFEGYDSDILYVSFEIKLQKSVTGETFAEDMKKLESVDHVTDTLKQIEFFSSLKRGIEMSGWIAIGVLGVLSVLVAMNTIKLTVIARRKELEIMKFIGASDTYTCGPFVIEGLTIGIIGSLLAYIIVKYIYGLLNNYFSTRKFFNEFIELVDFKNASHSLLLYFTVIGIAVGVLSSAAAIRKYIKV